MQIVIGLIGEIRSGKETFVKLLREAVGDKTEVRTISTSQFLREKLRPNQPPTRANLQQIAIDLVAEHGQGYLSKSLKGRIEQFDDGITVFDCIRWQTEFDMIRSFPNHKTVYITADPKIRYQRVLKANGKTGESSTTYEQFLKESQAKTEVVIAQLGEKADFKIINNQGLAEFKDQILQLFLKANL